MEGLSLSGEREFGRLTMGTALLRVHNASDPCNPASNGATQEGLCMQAWRWSLETIEDTSGNKIEYYYASEENFYDVRSGGATNWMSVPYQRATRLVKVQYARSSGLDRQQILLAYLNRCTTTACNWWEYPDTPWDLSCNQGQANCATTGPTFWSSQRIASIFMET